MKAGDKVTIYGKWVTEEDPEGEATLVKKIMDGPGYEFWRVQFKGESGLYHRFIRKELERCLSRKTHRVRSGQSTSQSGGVPS